MPPDTIIEVSGPFVGVDTTRESRELAPNEASDALNVNLDGGTLEGILGYSQGSVAPNNEPIEGIHEYRRVDGTRILLVKAGAQLYRVDSGVFTAIGTALLTAGNQAQFLTLNDRVFIVHGGTPKVTDGTDLFDWLIAKPTFAPTLALASGAGKLSGEYDYKITFNSSTWGQDSPSSPSTNETDTTGAVEKTTTVSPTNQWVTLTNFDTTTDARVDRYRIYRRKFSNDEPDWRLIDEVPSSTTSYTDRVPDNNVSLTSIAPLTFDPEFPAARFIAYNSGVIFVSGIDLEPTAVYFTPVDKTVLGAFDVVDDVVTGLIAFQGQLVTFTSKSIWLFSGTTLQTLFKRRSIADRGCVAPFSIISVDNVIFFLSENGVYSYDLSQVREVSRPVKGIWQDRNFARDNNIVAVHDWKNSAVWWSYSGSGSSTNNKMLVHFYRNSAVTEQPSWVPWDIPGLSNIALFTNETTKLRDIKLGFSNGRVATYGDATDFNGSAIEYSWISGDQDVRAPHLVKKWGAMHVDNVEQISGEIQISVSVEGDAFRPVGRTFDLTERLFSGRIARRGAQLRTKFSGSLKDGVKIVKWRYEVEAGSKR